MAAMTMNEFKAWLEGYSASFRNGRPNEEQWGEIKRRLDGVGLPIQAPAQWASIQAWPSNVQSGGMAAMNAVSTRVYDPLTGRDLGSTD